MASNEERALVRLAERQALQVVKSRRRDPRGVWAGKWCVLDRHGTMALVSCVKGRREWCTVPEDGGTMSRRLELSDAAWLSYAEVRWLLGLPPDGCMTNEPHQAPASVQKPAGGRETRSVLS